MKWLALAFVFVLVGVLGCSGENPVAVSLDDEAIMAKNTEVASRANANACWGQATKVFAQTGVMGEHASAQPTPRVGLRNLARALYDQGVIDEPTMQALGEFVAAELGLSIDACMTE